MTDRLILLDLVAAVQVRAVGSDLWKTTAAFDLIVTAEAYAERASAGTREFAFRVVPLDDAKQMTGDDPRTSRRFRHPGKS
jgi:hypothetical protein